MAFPFFTAVPSLFYGQLVSPGWSTPDGRPANSRAALSLRTCSRRKLPRARSWGPTRQWRDEMSKCHTVVKTYEIDRMISCFFWTPVLLDVWVIKCVCFFEFLGWLIVSTYDDLKGPVCGILEAVSWSSTLAQRVFKCDRYVTDLPQILLIVVRARSCEKWTPRKSCLTAWWWHTSFFRDNEKLLTC